MSDYTKGPWHCKPNANGVYGADGYAITYPIVQAITVLGSDDQSHQWVNRNAEANARLIATATELLEALEVMLHSFMCTQNPNDYPSDAPCNKARAAIAKAKGEQK